MLVTLAGLSVGPGAVAALVGQHAAVLAHPGAAVALAGQQASALAHPGAAAADPRIYVADNAPPYAVTVIDPRTRAEKTVPLGSSESVAFASSPDGSTEYVLGFSQAPDAPGRLVAIHASSASEEWSTAVGDDPEYLAVNPDGRTAYVVDGLDMPGTMTPVALATGLAGKAIPVGVNPEGIVVAPNGGRAFVTDANEETGRPTGITPVDLATDSPGATIHVPALDLVVTADSAWVYAVTTKGLVRIDTATGVPGPAIGLGPVVPEQLLLSPNGATLYVLATPDPGLAPAGVGARLIPVSTAHDTVGKPIALPRLTGPAPSLLAVTPNGSNIFVLSPGKEGGPSSIGVLEQVDATSGTLSRTVSIGFNPNALAVDPDGATVYVLSPGKDDGAPGPVPGGGPRRTPGKVIPVSVASGTLGTPMTTGLAGQLMAIAP